MQYNTTNWALWATLVFTFGSRVTSTGAGTVIQLIYSNYYLPIIIQNSIRPRTNRFVIPCKKKGRLTDPSMRKSFNWI